MTIASLMTVVGIVLALFALAHPVQRRSIAMFVAPKDILGSLVCSAVLLFIVEAFEAAGVTSLSFVWFLLRTSAIVIPIGAAAHAYGCWREAKLTADRTAEFRQFLLACLHEGAFEELIRILRANATRLPEVLDEDTMDLVFDRRSIEALVSARSWVHLELLGNRDILEAFPRHFTIVDRVVRVYLLADESPLRKAALLGEGGDETIFCTEEEDSLIRSTLRNPEWYQLCRVDYPLVIAACQRIDSGELDDAYNRADASYVATQGISRRSRCPVSLAVNTIAHAMEDAVEQGIGTAQDTYYHAAGLWDIFRAVLPHSAYRRETWDEPSGYGDYPTPFGFLLSKILSDYDLTCYAAREKSDYGKHAPPENLRSVVRSWANCVMWLTEDKGYVSPGFRMGRIRALLEMTMQCRQLEVHATDENRDGRSAWTRLFVEHLKHAATSWLPESNEYLREAIAGMDTAKDHISKNRDWLRHELELDK